MKACWVVNPLGSYGAGLAPWDKLKALDVKRVYLPSLVDGLRPGYMVSRLLDDVHAHGFEIGIYRDPGWMNDSAADLARYADADLVMLNAGSKQCAYDFDIEKHDPDYLKTFARAWRKLRPTRASAVTFEPFQGGWLGKVPPPPAEGDAAMTVVQVLSSANLLLKPQLYFGGMQPAAADRVVFDLLDWGADRSQIECVYDGAHLPGRWDGTIFAAERLP